MEKDSYCQLEIAESQTDALTPLLEENGFEENGTTDDETTIFECHYNEDDADAKVRDRLIKDKVVHYGYHGATRDLNPEVFAFDGTEASLCPCLEQEPVVRLDDNGEVKPDSLQSARDYLRVLKSAKLAVKRINAEAEAGNEVPNA